MNRTLPVIAVAALVALSACSQAPDQSTKQNQGAALDDPDAPYTAAPVPDVSEAAASPTDSESAVAEDDTDTSAIPRRLQGRWGLVAADCTSTAGDAKGLMEITGDEIRFYESVAKIGTIKEAGGNRIRADFSYSGEGQSWTQDVVLAASDSGETLVRREYGANAAPGPFTYMRCPS